METNNTAKLRVALETIAIRCVASRDFDPVAEIDAIKTIANAALSAPLRNCDVGTAKEQAKRFEEFCDGYAYKTKYNSCGTCPLWTSGTIGKDCELKWAQMPYKKGGAK